MYFYFYAYPIIFGANVVTPKDTFNSIRGGINFDFCMIKWDRTAGKCLYKVKIDDAYTQQEKDDHKATIMALAASWAASEIASQDIQSELESFTGSQYEDLTANDNWTVKLDANNRPIAV
jgi:hypothetical protein